MYAADGCDGLVHDHNEGRIVYLSPGYTAKYGAKDRDRIPDAGVPSDDDQVEEDEQVPLTVNEAQDFDACERELA